MAVTWKGRSNVSFVTNVLAVAGILLLIVKLKKDDDNRQAMAHQIDALSDQIANNAQEVTLMRQELGLMTTLLRK